MVGYVVATERCRWISVQLLVMMDFSHYEIVRMVSPFHLHHRRPSVQKVEGKGSLPIVFLFKFNNDGYKGYNKS